ncbi:hypothetical protein AHAS_Ahas02G0067500 [Arachis hypogaea]
MQQHSVIKLKEIKPFRGELPVLERRPHAELRTTETDAVEPRRTTETQERHAARRSQGGRATQTEEAEEADTGDEAHGTAGPRRRKERRPPLADRRSELGRRENR